MNFVSPSELPDYKPPFGTGAVRADADGNLWVRTIPAKPVAGGVVYDVVSRGGGELPRRRFVPSRARQGRAVPPAGPLPIRGFMTRSKSGCGPAGSGFNSNMAPVASPT